MNGSFYNIAGHANVRPIESRIQLFACMLLTLALQIAMSSFCQAQLPPRPTPALRPQSQNAVEQSLQDTLQQAEQSVFISAPRELLRPLIRANRAIASRETSRAVALLGEVLNESTNEDYLVPVLGTEGLSVSLRLRAQMTLGQLSTKDRELYRLRYGVQAKQMLEKAIEDGDFDLVSQVMQRFFFTPAGFDAAMLLGHHHLDQGRPIAAANCFERITKTEEARAVHDPEASVLLAICWMLGDAPDEATKALVQLRANTRKNTMEVLGNPVRLFERPDDALPWLKRLVGNSPLLQNEMVNQWLMAGGNPQRNARNGMGVPLINPRWSTPTLNNPDMEKAVRDQLRDLVFLDSAPIPAVQPLAIGDTVVMRAFDRMIGVDFKTGKRVWVFPPWDFATDNTRPGEPLTSRSVATEPLTERMWLDAVYGQASSDGKSIFVVPDPGFSRDVEMDAGLEQAPVVVRIYNELMSIDLAREGAFRWAVGGESGLDEPKLAKSFFLGPPLPLQDELYVVCQQNKEIRLVVLNAESGKLKWSQTLGATENSRVDLSEDRFRRLAGVSPSYSNGILVCATGTGALTAVDLSTHSLIWGYQYTTPGRKPVQRISPLKKSSSDPLAGIWRDSSITISDGKVLFTPVESQDLICVNLQNGFPAWVDAGKVAFAKFNRNDSLFVACVENGLAILVGESSIRAVNVQNGQQVWETALGEHGRPSGRGYANSGSYFFPTTSETLICVDLRTGNVVKSVRTDGVLGNLICYRGDVISHGVDRLVSFPQDEPKRRLLALAESDGELSAELLAIKSQLQIQDGQIVDAVKSIEAAYQQDPNRAYEKLLLDLVIRIVEQDFANGTSLAEKYRAQLLANRRFEYLVANVNGMVRTQQYGDAFDALLELVRPFDQIDQLRQSTIPIDASKFDRFGGVSANSDVDASRGKVNVRIDQWIASRIEILHAECSPELRLRIESELGVVVDQLTELNPGPVDLLNAISMLPVNLVPPARRVILAQRLAQDNQPLRAIKLLDSLILNSDLTVMATAVAAKAEVLVKQKEMRSAQALIDRLQNEFAVQPVSSGETGSQIADALKRQIAANGLGALPVHWKRGMIKSTSTTVDVETANLIPCVVTLESYDQKEYAEYQFRFYGQTGEIEILDANGQTAFRFFGRQQIETIGTAYNSYVFGRISIRNHVALLDIATEMFAFDWLKLKNGEDPLLWNRAIRTGNQDHRIATVSRQWNEIKTSTNPRNYEERVYVSAPGLNGICFIENSQLICLDTLTGNRIWQRTSILPHSVLFGDDQNVVVWNAKKRRADVIDIASGRVLQSTLLSPEIGAIWGSRGTRVLVSTVRKQGGAENASAIQPRREPGGSGEDSDQPKPIMEKTLGLYDLLADRFVWSSVYPVKTMGCLVQQDRIALLPPGKNIQVLDLDSGAVEFETDIGLSDAQRRQVSAIGVAALGDRLLFHLKRGDTYNRVDIEELNVEIKYINYSDTMWMGAMVCVDANTGVNVWRNPVLFDNFQLSQGQPFNLPVYFLSRRVEKEDEFGNRRDFLNFAAIDLESGELLINELQAHGYPNTVSFRCEPEEQKILIGFANTRVVYQLSDPSDLPPRPVAHLTNQNSVPDVNLATASFSFDKKLIAVEKAKSLERAKQAEKLMPQKRAAEKRLLEQEKSGN